MNVSDGGKQPFNYEIKRSTKWDGEDKLMITSAGLQKGFKSLLEDRRIDTTGMRQEEMIKIVSEMRDFKYQKTRVEELILRVMFIPKFHCELNPIKRVWCHAKRYTCLHCDYSFPHLEKIIDEVLDSVSLGF